MGSKPSYAKDKGLQHNLESKSLFHLISLHCLSVLPKWLSQSRTRVTRPINIMTTVIALSSLANSPRKGHLGTRSNQRKAKSCLRNEKICRPSVITWIFKSIIQWPSLRKVRSSSFNIDSNINTPSRCCPVCHEVFIDYGFSPLLQAILECVAAYRKVQGNLSLRHTVSRVWLTYIVFLAGYTTESTQRRILNMSPEYHAGCEDSGSQI